MSYKQAMKHWHNHKKQRFSQPIVQGFRVCKPEKPKETTPKKETK